MASTLSAKLIGKDPSYTLAAGEEGRYLGFKVCRRTNYDETIIPRPQADFPSFDGIMKGLNGAKWADDDTPQLKDGVEGSDCKVEFEYVPAEEVWPDAKVSQNLKVVCAISIMLS